MGRYLVALVVLVAAVFAFGVAATNDGWGAAAQYGLGALAVLALGAIGYAIPRLRVLLVPWGALAILMLLAVLLGEDTPDGALDWVGAVALLAVWGFFIALPIAAGMLVRLAACRLHGRGGGAAAT
jgi:hypothetical protein